MMLQIAQLDIHADSSGLDEEAWATRYHLEDQLLHIYQVEEEYWRQRGRVRWVLHGDANTAYFHAVANGRRHKCNISSLNTSAGIISDPRQIQENMYAFYGELLGITTPRGCGLALSTWVGVGRVSEEENINVALTFTETNLDYEGDENYTAPGLTASMSCSSRSFGRW
jgi:hypothetical protein